MTHETAYRLHDLKFRYSEQFLLDVPSLEIEKGSSVGFAGPNGSGKTTLLKILAFLEKRYEGHLLFDGTDAREIGEEARTKVTYLLQDPYLLKRSVYENVAWGLKVRGERHGLRERVYEALDWVGLDPKTYASRRWNEISGGEAKRAALASRLVLKTEVLILDEPTANVDRKSAIGIRNAIERIRAEDGVTLIIASHDEVWLHEISESVLRVSGGKIVGRGADNIIHGPWRPDGRDLWTKTLSDGQAIFGVGPPTDDGIAVLDPSSIIISNSRPAGMSARNILKGVVAHMWEDGGSEKLRVEVEVSGAAFLCLITRFAADDLRLLPGKEVWIVFKASSMQWYRPESLF
ncbi:MAG: ATP-binding cassette domain-containing protein [Spirochaetes bacterium]|nr:ATP-binding cassette domain-containing protein [Spirochaetota bacterium]